MTSDNKHMFKELFDVRGSNFHYNKIVPYWQGLKAGNKAKADNIWPHESPVRDFFRENRVDTQNRCENPDLQLTPQRPYL